MSEVFPFEGIHYNPKLNLSRLISPPYDQISPKLQEDLYHKDPYNFVRLIFGKILSEDSERSNRYTRAAEDLEAWLKQEILVKKNQPCFYAYEQNFSLKDGISLTRLGLVGLMRLEPFGGGVLPHEKTFSKPKEDRLNLMKACKANFEHVFLLYDDPNYLMRQILAPYRCKVPFLSCRDSFGTSHALWVIPDSPVIAKIQSFFKNKQLLIADGHHRYETSLAYQKEMSEIWCGSESEEAPFNFRLATFVGLQDPGLVILPTHRVLRNLPQEKSAGLENALLTYFEFESAGDLTALQEKAGQKKYSFGWATANKLGVFTLKPSFDPGTQFAGSLSSLRELDVFILQKLVFEKILNLPENQLDQFISYLRWADDALKLVRTGSHQAAFFLNPVKPEQVKVVAQSGETMPHKSTDFYPKLWSGLVFYKMEM